MLISVSETNDINSNKLDDTESDGGGGRGGLVHGIKPRGRPWIEREIFCGILLECEWKLDICLPLLRPNSWT